MRPFASGDRVASSIEMAGFGIQPIEISAKQVSKELDFVRSRIGERVEWDEQIDAMNHVMGLINGGALEHDDFAPGLVSIRAGIVAALKHTRPAVGKRACLLLALLARELGSQFDVIGEYIGPLCAQVESPDVGEYCEYLITFIARKCQSRKVLSSIIEICGMKSVKKRLVGAKALAVVTSVWQAKSIGTNWSRLFQVLSRLLNDKSSDIQQVTKEAIKDLERLSPQKAKEFMQKIDKGAMKETESTRRRVVCQARSKNLAKKTLTVQFVKGQEKGFANQVRDLIDSGKVNEIDLTSIIKNLLTCCWHPSSTVSVVALTALQDLLAVRSDEFVDLLPEIMPLLLHQAQSASPRCSTKANMMLQQLPTLFDVNEVCKTCVTLDPSLKLLEYAVALGQDPEFKLVMAFYCLEACTEEAATVISDVFEMHPDVFQTVVDGFEPDVVLKYQELIPNIPMKQMELVDIPPISVENEDKILELTDRSDWPIIRSSLYLQLDKAMMNGDQFATQMAQTVLRRKGFDDFKLMLHGLLTSATGKNARVANSVLTAISQSVDSRDVIAALQPCLKAKSPEIISNCLAYERQVISTMSKRDLKPLLPEIVDNLKQHASHRQQNIRKATASCLAELQLNFGSEMSKLMDKVDPTCRSAVSVALSIKRGTRVY